MDSIEYYNKYASKVFEDTVDQNMEELREEFLGILKVSDGDTILDLGCGSGRDSLVFYELGYDVTPLDASEEMCKLAEIHTGLDVLCMNYEDMEFEDVFDGIWACASLLHIPKAELSLILDKAEAALKMGGVLYFSVRKGNFEGFRGERYFSDYTESELERIVKARHGLELIKIWETMDVRSNHPDTVWMNVMVRKH